MPMNEKTDYSVKNTETARETSEITARTFVRTGIKSAGIVTPRNMSRMYIDIARAKEAKLVRRVENTKHKTDSISKEEAKASSFGFGGTESIKLKKAEVKNQKANEKLRAFYSKNYRTETIRHEIGQKVSKSILGDVNGSLTGLRKDMHTSSILGNKRTSLKRVNASKAGKVKKPFGNKMKKAGLKSLKIAEITKSFGSGNSGNPQGVIKGSLLVAANTLVNGVFLIVKGIIRMIIKFLMPIIPYIMLVFIPFILILLSAAAGAANEEISELYESTTKSTQIQIVGDTPEAIMHLAESYVGTKEATGNNDVIFNTHYYGYEVYGQKYAWCGVFVWDIFRMAGAGDYINGVINPALADNYRIWGEKNNLTVPITEGRCGDIILFDYENNGIANHVGLILSQNKDGSYVTIEGNTSNQVSRLIRYPSSGIIMTIVRPEY